MSIGLNIRTLRNEKRLSQKELAEKLGVATGSVSGYEIGTSQPSIEKLIQLSEIFDVSIDFLVDNQRILNTENKSSESTSTNQTNSDMEKLLHEKDLRIEELYKRIDDKERMIALQESLAASRERFNKIYEQEYERLKKLYPDRFPE